MPVPNRHLVAVGDKSVESELTDRLQHPETRVPTRTLLLPQQALLHQRRDAVENLVPRTPVPSGHRLGGGQVEPADEHRPPPE